MDFGDALEVVKNGAAIARVGWNGKGMWVKLHRPDGLSKMQRPYLYMSTVDGELVPWVASHTDLLAEDWDTVAG